MEPTLACDTFFSIFSGPAFGSVLRRLYIYSSCDFDVAQGDNTSVNEEHVTRLIGECIGLSKDFSLSRPSLAKADFIFGGEQRWSSLSGILSLKREEKHS